MDLDAQQVENTFYVSALAPLVESDLEEIAQTVDVWWTENCIELYVNTLRLSAITVTAMDAATSPSYVLPAQPLSIGGVAFAALPNNAAFTITFLSAARGRSNRGRNYITGLAASHVTNNTVEDTHVEAWLVAYNTLQTAINNLNRFMVIASKYSGVDVNGKPIPREEGVTVPVNGFRVFDRIVDSQRRRLPGRGQ
jgi:hypothetical protein